MAEMRDAAVLIPVAGDALVFTVRAAELPSHAGHVSFPGGKREPTDTSLRDTALRETEEEIRLDRSFVEITGTLPVHKTLSSGFRIKPFVGRVPEGLEFTPNMEVDEVFTVSLNRLHRSEVQGDDGIRYPCGPYTIWGVTARILASFLDQTDPA